MKSLQRPRPLTLALFGLFLVVTAVVLAGSVQPWDDAVLRAIGDWRTSTRTDWMLGITFLGNGLIEVPMAFTMAWLLHRAGRGAIGNRYLLAVVTGELCYLLLKALIHRPRPTIIERLGDAGWYSYPSGHTMLAPILWSFGFLLLAEAVANRVAKGVLVVGAVLLPILIGTSRVYLGVHYPSDVLGALSLGSAWVVWWWPRSSDAARSSSTAAVPAIK